MGNKAAWLSSPNRQLQIGSNTIPEPGKNEIVIENRAVPIDPIDWKLQAGILPIPLTYPTVLGTSVAGYIRKVGSEVTRFKEGDRVLSNSSFILQNSPRYGAHQQFTLSTQELTSHIFDVPFEEATSAASASISMSALVLHLKLDRPHTDSTPKSDNVLIWGGASSVGTYAVQFAAQAGYQVVATASTHNKGFVTLMGAKKVFDYNSPTIYEDLLMQGPYKAIFAAADSSASQMIMCKLMAAQGGGEILSTMGPRGGVNFPAGVNIVFAQFLDDYSNVENAEFCAWVFWDFLESGFKNRTLKLGAIKVAGGLDKLQSCFDTLREGKVSGKKLVILPYLD